MYAFLDFILKIVQADLKLADFCKIIFHISRNHSLVI